MLGCLFEEDSDERAEHLKRLMVNSRRKAEDADHNSSPSLPHPRPSTRFCGLGNRGATCYLNSVIQTLALTPEFRERLFAIGPDELGSLEQPDSGTRVIPIHLQRLLARLLLADRDTASTEDLLQSFGWTVGQQEGQQHDVQELTITLLDALERSLVFTSGSGIIGDLFRGRIVRRITCGECGTVSEREESFLDLGVALSGCDQLEEALILHYLGEEVLDGDNKYSCSVCQHATDAVRRTAIRQLPDILIFVLMRFTFDLVGERRVKNTNRFAFPTELDMSAFVDQSHSEEDDTGYELYSSVIHRGGAHGGHYHAFIRDIDDLGDWQAGMQGDCKTGKGSSSAKFDADDPASVVEFILRQKGDEPTTTDALVVELGNLTGRSWTKRYRSRFGTFKKFLHSNDKFHVTEQAPHLVTLLDCVAEEPAEKVDDGAGHRWFDFDDSWVKPIASSAIQKQFVGNESAYMLFYRRQSLRRPEEALGNPYFRIPSAFTDLVDSENTALRLDRDREVTARNRVTVHVHLGSGHIIRDDCCLSPCFGRRHEVSVALEPNAGVTRVLQLLSEKCTAEERGDGSTTLSVCRSLPAGLHLYEDLSSDWRTPSVKVGDDDDLHLFLWDGISVGGEQYNVRGDKEEPILLSLVLGTGEGVTHAFRRSTDIVCFRVLVTELLDVPFGNFDMCWERFSDREHPSNLVRLEPSDDEKSLAQMGVADLDRFVIQCDVPNPQTTQDDLSAWTAKMSDLVVEDGFVDIDIEDKFQTVKSKRRGVNKGCKNKNVDAKAKAKVSNEVPKVKTKIPKCAKPTKPALFDSERAPERGISINVGNFLY